MQKNGRIGSLKPPRNAGFKSVVPFEKPIAWARVVKITRGRLKYRNIHKNNRAGYKEDTSCAIIAARQEKQMRREVRNEELELNLGIYFEYSA